MIFDPECDHCQITTRSITSNISRFKNVQVIMVTYLSHKKMLRFYKDYKIASYRSITMGSDPKFFFPIYYKAGGLPAIFIYDNAGKFKKAMEGTISADKIIDALFL